jgi:stress-induced morphogen
MTTIPLPALAQAMQQRLAEKLNPTVVEVVDESAAHTGHAGANGTGLAPISGAHCVTFVYRKKPRCAASPCV